MYYSGHALLCSVLMCSYIILISLCQVNTGRWCNECQSTSCTVDNRWIVPHAVGEIFEFMDCHWNVQLNTSVGTIKYLYQYLYKGVDKAEVRVQRNNPDEIDRYMLCKWFGACEATWRQILETAAAHCKSPTQSPTLKNQKLKNQKLNQQLVASTSPHSWRLHPHQLELLQSLP